MRKWIGNTFGFIIHRERFNKLVKDLRNKGCLDEDNLKEIIKYRGRLAIFHRLSLYFLAVPSSLFLAYLAYLFFSNPEIIVHHGVTKIVIYTFTASLIVIIYFAMIRQDIEAEWKYILLMTFGKRTSGTVTFFSKDYQSGRVFCEYYFFDDAGHKVFSEMQIAYRFDDTFSYKNGEVVGVAYNTNDHSIVISQKIKRYNIKKGII